MTLRDARNYGKSHDFAENLLPYLFMCCFSVQGSCVQLQAGKPELKLGCGRTAVEGCNMTAEINILNYIWKGK